MRTLLFATACLTAILAIGCTQSGSDPATTEGENGTDATLVSFSVPGMTWPVGCIKAVRETLQGLPGVADVQIQFEDRIATCKVDETFDAEAAVAALAEDERFTETTILE